MNYVSNHVSCLKLLQFKVFDFARDVLKPIKSLPRCPHNYLKNLHITWFSRTTGQLEFLVHTVENAPILKIFFFERNAVGEAPTAIFFWNNKNPNSHPGGFEPGWLGCTSTSLTKWAGLTSFPVLKILTIRGVDLTGRELDHNGKRRFLVQFGEMEREYLRGIISTNVELRII